MEDPWQFLILDPNTATEKDVKAAYARLLKQHRPDKDPAGFRKLREAYEAALEAVQRRNATPAPPVIGAGQETMPEEAPEAATPLSMPLPMGRDALPETLRPAYDDLEHAIASENTEQMQAAVQRFEMDCRQAGVSGAELAGALQKAFHDDPKLTARGMTDTVLVKLAEEGQMNFCHVIVSAWQEADNTVRLVEYGNALLKRCAFLSSSDGAVLMARIGLVVALEHPLDATRLANAAFPHLPVEGREHMMNQLERGIALGNLFSDLPPDQRPFWFRQLRADSGGQDWSTPEAKKAVNYLIECRGAQWGGWGVVNGLMAPEVWKPVEEKLRKQVKRVRNAQGGGGWGVPRFLLGPAFFIIIAIVRMLGPSLSTGNHYPDINSRASHDANDSLRRYYELTKNRNGSGVQAPNPSPPQPFFPTQSSQPAIRPKSSFSPTADTPYSDRRVLDNLRGPGSSSTLQLSPAPRVNLPPSSPPPKVPGLNGNPVTPPAPPSLMNPAQNPQFPPLPSTPPSAK